MEVTKPILIEKGNCVVALLPHTPLATPEETVVEYLKEHDKIKNGVAREMTGIRSENQMKEVFNVCSIRI